MIWGIFIQGQYDKQIIYHHLGEKVQNKNQCNKQLIVAYVLCKRDQFE